jgi:hypothetical protein
MIHIWRVHYYIYCEQNFRVAPRVSLEAAELERSSNQATLKAVARLATLPLSTPRATLGAARKAGLLVTVIGSPLGGAYKT